MALQLEGLPPGEIRKRKSTQNAKRDALIVDLRDRTPAEDAEIQRRVEIYRLQVELTGRIDYLAVRDAM